MPPLLRFRLGIGPGRQRTMQHEGHLLMVLHDVPQCHDQQRTGQLFWRNPEGIWRSTIAGDGTTGVERHLAIFSRTIDHLMADFDQADGSKDYFRLLEDLGPLVRSTRNLHGALEQARDVHELINWRDEAYSLVRRVELLQGDAKIALDFEIARQAETQAEASHQMATSAHRLNVLETFFSAGDFVCPLRHAI